jgi:hypothetical protein
MALPVRRLVLFQHGLGFFVRSGDVDAQFTVDVPRRAMDDVLKSLTIVTSHGVNVSTVTFETPDDRNPAARREPLVFDANTPLSSVVLACTGHRVEVLVGKKDRRIVGDLIGIEREDEDHLERALLVVNSPDGIELVELSAVQRITLLDDVARSDLSFGLEERRRDVDRGQARVVLSGPANVDVHYTAPAPAWRVSYRVLIEMGEHDHAADPTRRDVIVQGWGLFDNTLDEDLNAVELTLTAGMPVSFRYELHEPNTPDRPMVRDERRTLAEVFEFDEMSAGPGFSAEMEFERSASVGAVASSARMLKAPAPASAGRARLMQADAAATAAPVQAVGESRGALFAYNIANPVTVRRGESAMVPIAELRAVGARELLYNPRKTPDHPSVSVRVRNDALVLERGPATVFESGNYAGEAIVPFTTQGGEVVLGFALELGVRVTPIVRERTETRSIRVRDGSLLVGVIDIYEAEYTIDSKLASAAVVTVEHPRTYDTELVTGASASSAAEARFQVTVGARSSAVLNVVEEREREYRQHVAGLDGLSLQRYLDDKLLDRATFDSLAVVIALHAELASLDVARNQRDQACAKVRERLDDVRSNLSALDATRDSALRDKFVAQLEDLEGKLVVLDDADAAALVLADELDARISAALAALT